MEFEYGRIEPVDDLGYIEYEISHFAYKLKLRKFNLVYHNHHKKSIVQLLKWGYGIRFINIKNGCFFHSEIIEEKSFKICFACGSYATQILQQVECKKCHESITQINVKGSQTSMCINVFLYLLNSMG